MGRQIVFAANIKPIMPPKKQQRNAKPLAGRIIRFGKCGCITVKMLERGLSNSTLDDLWRRAVKKGGGYRCRNCGGGGTLEAHHCVHRRYSLLRWDVRNGTPVHAGDCHAAVNLLGVGAARPEDQQYLINTACLTKKQYLQEQGLSESEWRQQVKAELEAKVRE